MTTQLPQCIPPTLHCTPIEPCPTINLPCPPPPQAQAGGANFTPATVCTQHGCHTHVYASSCPPATVCPQPTTLCPQPQQQYGGGGGTAATVCTQYGCHTHVYATNCPPATVCAQPTTLCPQPQAQAQPGPTPTATFYPGCYGQGGYAQGPGPVVSAATQCPTVPPMCPVTHWQCPPQAGITCLPYTLLPVTFPPGCHQG